MIGAILVIGEAGQARVARFYDQELRKSHAQQQSLIRRVAAGKQAYFFGAALAGTLFPTDRLV